MTLRVDTLHHCRLSGHSEFDFTPAVFHSVQPSGVVLVLRPWVVGEQRCQALPQGRRKDLQQLLRAGADKDLTNFDIWFLIMWYEYTTTTNTSASELASYYQQLAYYSYYNQLYGGYGYGYGSSSYGYGSSYSNYYNYMMMAQYASASATQTSVNTEMDKDRYYHAVLNGPTAPGRKPKLKFTYALPRE